MPLSTAAALLLLLLLLLAGRAAGAGTEHRWVETSLAPPTAETTRSFFGAAVALDPAGSLAAVGAYRAETVHLFRLEEESATWAHSDELRPFVNTGGMSTFFGWSAAVLPRRVLVGAPGFDGPGGFNTGQAFVFDFDERSGDWREGGTLLVGAAGTGWEFGSSVALHQDRALVGAPGASDDKGLAFLFRASPAGWIFEAELSDVFRRRFGEVVALSAMYAAIGGPRTDTANGGDTGAVWVFRRSELTWALDGLLLSDRQTDMARFGSALAFGDDGRINVGVRLYSDENGEDTGTIGGAVLQFKWTQVQHWTLADRTLVVAPLEAMAISNKTVVAGSRREDNTDTNAGAVRLFAQGGVLLSLFEGTEAFGELGASVAAKGDFVLAGAPGEGVVKVYHRQQEADSEPLVEFTYMDGTAIANAVLFLVVMAISHLRARADVRVDAGGQPDEANPTIEDRLTEIDQRRSIVLEMRE